MDAQALLQLLQLLPNLALPVATLIRELLNANGYSVDKLLSAGTSLNAQTLTHVEMEINRVKGLLGAKGGDPQISAVNFAPIVVLEEVAPVQAVESNPMAPSIASPTVAPKKK